MKLKFDTSKTYALTLEGGGARGAYQIGAFEALSEAGVKINAAAGTSVGALNGALISMGNMELARELCLNKSTVARALNCLEEKCYITRQALQNDKRQFAVYPTEKMLNILPEVKQASVEWMTLLSEGIPAEELAIFDSVLERMQSRAREIIESQEENK